VARLETDRQRLGWGVFCLALSGAVIGVTLYRDASWSLDGIEAVAVLLPIGIYLVLKGGLGYDVVADVKRLLGRG
jgi:hypothetical protein